MRVRETILVVSTLIIINAREPVYIYRDTKPPQPGYIQDTTVLRQASH
jgi:hypothetical protein